MLNGKTLIGLLVVVSGVIACDSSNSVDNNLAGPSITSLSVDPDTVSPGNESNIEIQIEIDRDSRLEFTYKWTLLSGGTLSSTLYSGEISGQNASTTYEHWDTKFSVIWTAPNDTGQFQIEVEVGEKQSDEVDVDTVSVTVI